MGSPQLGDWLIVVPARLQSQRLPMKPLQDLAGKPLIQRTFENLKPLASLGAKIIVAVDSTEVEHICVENHIPCIHTKVDHPSGTDRCHEVSQRFPSKFVMNVQGDEPFADLSDLKRLASAMEREQTRMGTLAVRSTVFEDFKNPNVVKIVRTARGRALYFSRATVPYDRENLGPRPGPVSFWQHLGVYAFTRDSLSEFCALPPSALEMTEKLEQLRAVEAGWSIHVEESKHVGIGIDTPEDLARAHAFIVRKGL